MSLRASARAFALLVPIAMACAGASHAAPPRTVERVDLSRYTGQWYEVARLPNSFQSQCVRDVVAVYEAQADGTMAVINRCRVANGEVDEAVGVARVADPATRAKLEVRFAPAFLSFLPFVWADYWVLGLDPEYRWAVVGTPDRRFLWILARTPNPSDADYQAALSVAAAQGFDAGRVVRTEHATSTPATGAAAR